MTTKHTHRANRRRRGFTLTEIAIVLGIVGLILGSIWAAAAAVYANLKVSQAQQGITLAAQSVRSMFAGSNQTGTTTFGSITTPGMFPISWASTTVGVVGNPWNQNPTGDFAYIIGDPASLNSFAVELDGISAEGCAALISFYNANASTQSTAGAGQIAGLVGSVLKTGVPTAGTPKAGVASPIPTAWAAANFALPSGCTGNANGNNIAIEFDMSFM